MVSHVDVAPFGAVDFGVRGPAGSRPQLRDVAASQLVDED